MADSGSRRTFFTQSGRFLALSLTGGLLWGGFLRRNPATALVLRPPGAKQELEFSSACVKCGQCVDACPYQTLSLFKSGEAGEIGTPYFTARSIPCYMCQDVPCARACPSGALDQSVTIEKSKMGLAVLLDQESCIAFQGLRCEVCYRACPLIDQAITLSYRSQSRTGKHAFFEPVVHAEACTGCGMCERVCILEESAIRILPISIAKGKMGKNYRLGWKEKSVIHQAEAYDPNSSDEVNDNNMLQNSLDALNDEGTLYE